jgi:AcrR family transcriptional regulator
LTIRKIRDEGFEHVRLIDIAREVGVSHVALYSYFADKSALMDAVSEKWLSDLDKSLDQICRSSEPIDERIRQYFLMLHRAKRERVQLEPELYKAFSTSAQLLKPSILKHLQGVESQVLRLTREASEAELLTGVSPETATNLLLEATYRFTEPQLVQQMLEEDREPLLSCLITALLRGFGFPSTP